MLFIYGDIYSSVIYFLLDIYGLGSFPYIRLFFGYMYYSMGGWYYGGWIICLMVSFLFIYGWEYGNVDG